MITKYSKNIIKQFSGIVRYNYVAILCFILLGSAAYVVNRIFNIEDASLPVVPVTILGGGLAIFLGFRNNAAYDRWWEARKIWGALVNSSRSFGTQVMSFANLENAKEGIDISVVKQFQKRVIYRHIAYINVLRMALRGVEKWDQIKGYLSEEEFATMMQAPNKAAYLNHLQGMDLEKAMNQGIIEDFRHMSLIAEINAFYDHQGMSERIKKTVFPFYYTYFTEVFLWLFIILLPFALAGTMNYMSVPLSVAISFVFYILDKSGKITEDPFENRAADTPLSSICKTIELDLRFQLGERDLPEAPKPRLTSFGAEYIK